MKTELKRQNFNITPEQEAELDWLKDATDASSTKDAILNAVRVYIEIAQAVLHGKSLYLVDETGSRERLLIPELEKSVKGKWTYLVERPHPWRRQLYVKGRRLIASTVWTDMLKNAMSRQEAADNWDLPVEAVDEIIQYCETNRSLLQMEAEEERRRLEAQGVQVEYKAAS